MLYDDPVTGYPPTYARDDIPKIEDSITQPPSNIEGHGTNNIFTVSIEATLDALR